MAMEKQYISRNLKNLYLDPNNYRFIDNDNYKFVPENSITEQNIQKRARNFIEGKNREDIKNLLDSFRSNGFLNVDVIQLKDLGNNNYLVLEGNRRVTALKALQEDYHNGFDIGNLDPDIFRRVPSEIYGDDGANHLIIMGLKHISGNKKWPAINQAKLIYDYLQPFWNNNIYSEREIGLCESLGITKQKLRTSQRAYHLILKYKESDYGDQFKSEMYYTFAEIIKRPSIKTWIGWDDVKYKATNDENTSRLFAWLSETEETEDLDEDEIDEEKKYPPIITKYREVQDLAKFIDNERAISAMEEMGSVAHGLLASGAVEEEILGRNIEQLKSNINELDRLKNLMSLENIEDLKQLKTNFSNILPKEYAIDVKSDNVKICFEKGSISHFSFIKAKQYKIFKEFEIKNLNRVNIFAGFNNNGKTTLLEAIFLLTKQNDIGAFFELTGLRNKTSRLGAEYLNSYFQKDITIEGVFNNTKTTVEIKKYQDNKIDQKDDYLTSYKIISSIDGESLQSTTHTFKVNPLQRFSDNVEILCQSIIKSPYFHNKNEVLQIHSRNVEMKTAKKVVDFIRNNIDKTIENIEFTESFSRFLVDSSDFSEHSVDLTSYGEGLQRIFEISLAFAYCKNGVLLIDELETAIHKSLLVRFTRFLQELAEEFNVQVFITSHSKECIDAFVMNEYKNNEISAYFMENINGKIDAIHVTGEKLKYYIENMDFDLRGNAGE